MGAGILPVSYHNGRAYFLFSREAMHNKFDKGKWGDFGGKKNKNETTEQTAIRECWEESSGFLGTKNKIRKLLKTRGICMIANKTYTTYIIDIPYDASLPKKFNTHFKKNITANYDNVVYNKKGLFEKDKLMWISFDKLKKNISRFRPFYRDIVRTIIEEYPFPDLFN